MRSTRRSASIPRAILARSCRSTAGSRWTPTTIICSGCCSNLARNAMQALEARAPNIRCGTIPCHRPARRRRGRDRGAGHRPGFPPRARENLFQASSGSARPGEPNSGWRLRQSYPRAWRRHSPRGGHDRRNLPPHHPGPGGRSRFLAGGAGQRLTGRRRALQPEAGRDGPGQGGTVRGRQKALPIGKRNDSYPPLRWPFVLSGRLPNRLFDPGFLSGAVLDHPQVVSVVTMRP